MIAALVARVKCNAIGHILDRIAVAIDLELVHALGVITWDRYGAGDRVADIDHEDGADLAPEHVEIGNVEPDVLARKRRIEVVGHDLLLHRAEHHRRLVRLVLFQLKPLPIFA